MVRPDHWKNSNWNPCLLWHGTAFSPCFSFTSINAVKHRQDFGNHVSQNQNLFRPVQVRLSHKYSNQVNTLIRHIQLWELIKRISAQTCHVNRNSQHIRHSLSTLRANRVDTHIRHVQLYPLIFFTIQIFSIKTCWTNCAIYIYLKAPTINGLHVGGKIFFL